MKCLNICKAKTLAHELIIVETKWGRHDSLPDYSTWWFAKLISYMFEIFHNKKSSAFILRVWLSPKKGKIKL